jgi:hypothetical protein
MTLIWSTGYIQVWDIAKSECIWTYPQLGSFMDERIIDCDAVVNSQPDNSRSVMTVVLKGYENEDASG